MLDTLFGDILTDYYALNLLIPGYAIPFRKLNGPAFWAITHE